MIKKGLKFTPELVAKCIRVSTQNNAEEIIDLLESFLLKKKVIEAETLNPILEYYATNKALCNITSLIEKWEKSNVQLNSHSYSLIIQSMVYQSTPNFVYFASIKKRYEESSFEKEVEFYIQSIKFDQKFRTLKEIMEQHDQLLK